MEQIVKKEQEIDFKPTSPQVCHARGDIYIVFLRFASTGDTYQN